ncbi:MarR family transcriptional regulator [Nocardioides sp.]|uniref:MarR family winged helix-turn-helix transcriptional regulator n=1 Tax=Nocardioides sp. TaxID=35761 RepID=UPI002C8BC60F|nr:MarR family transcriptional regulator [Nocardioides sp.]HXH79416.1 MarR family transcriptional regulator [Nocardioides sp.]
MRSISELPLEQRIGHVIKRAEQTLISGKTSALRATGLSVPQYAALLVLAEHPGISGAKLARYCMVTPQTMATMLAGLESKALIERQRSEDHGQVLVARLTRAGQALLRRADDRAVALERHLAAEFDPEERQTLMDLLERAIEAIDRFPPKEASPHNPRLS